MESNNTELKVTHQKSSSFKEAILSWPFQRIFLFLVLLRIPFLFIPVDLRDAFPLFIQGQFFFNGQLPYLDFNLQPYAEYLAASNVNPPIYYYLTYFWALISVNNEIVFGYVLKWERIGFDIGVMWLLYKVSREFCSEAESRMIMILYGINPISVFAMDYLGFMESFSFFFGLLAVYYIFRQRYFLSALFLTIAIAEKVMPIFYLLVIIPYFLKERKIIRLCLYLLEIVAIYLLISLPFLILCPVDFIEAHFTMLSKGSSILLFPNSLNFLFYGSVFTLSVFGSAITITLKTLIFIVIIVGLFIFIYWQFKGNSKRRFIDLLFLLQLFLPLSLLSAHYRFFYWIIPFSIIFYVSRRFAKFDLDKFQTLVIKVWKWDWVFAGCYLIIHYSIWGDYANATFAEVFSGNQLIFYIFSLVVVFGFWLIMNFIYSFDGKINKILASFQFLLLLSFVLVFSVDLEITPDWVKYVGTGALLIGVFGYLYYLRHDKQFLFTNLKSEINKPQIDTAHKNGEE